MNEPGTSVRRHHKIYLPILLWFLPLLALNIGYMVLNDIDLYWQHHEQKELAQQEVEALSAGSEFDYQFARLAGDFSRDFESLAGNDFTDKQFENFVKQRALKIFRRPFPEHELFVFKLPEKASGADIVCMQTDYRPSKRMFCRAFEHLVRVSRGDSLGGAVARQNETIVSSILGGDASSDVMATTQRGKASFAFYRFFPHRFLWDYFSVAGKGTFGFFLFTRSDDSQKNAGKLLALRDLRERKSALGAFVPIFKSHGVSVYQAPLHKSRLLKNWIKENVSQSEGELKKWLEKGTPPPAELGNYQVFSYLGKAQSHLSVLLMPTIKPPSRPLWLFLVNIFAVGFILLFLIKGALLGQWPSINLRLRFIMTYLLSATLPLSLLVITAYGYVEQFRRATHFQTVSLLQSSIKQYDSRKAQILEDYKTAFSEVFKDERLAKILLEQGADSEEAVERVLSFFRDRPQPLPLLNFAIMDELGNGARYYGGHSRVEADPAIDTFKYPIVSVLRKKIHSRFPGVVIKPFKPTAVQTTSVEAYRSMTGGDLADEIDKRRSFPITRRVGQTTATQMHDFITIDGCERFALFIVWDDQALDVKTFKQSTDFFALNNPEFVFLAYRITPQGLVYLNDPGRHVAAGFVDKAKGLAELSSFRGSYASARFENMSLVAMPSKKYDRTIIVGGTNHFALDRSAFFRLLVLAVILVLAIIIVSGCSYFSARIILDPITDLKSALDKVAAGQLNIEITSGSTDELGMLCREFTTMTTGLRQREKLATLISDQAIEAISKNSDGAPTTDSFSGVAMVSDIRNFTGMCEEYAPDLVTELLNEHFAQMAKIISEHGGRIYKFIGDAIEAVFSENDQYNENASTRAFKASSLMLARLAQINRIRGRQNLFNYRIGIGLAYGNMHSGTIGSLETRLDYAVIGEPLKVAARLESATVANPRFPLAVDELVAKRIADKDLHFVKMTEVDGRFAYSLERDGGLEEDKAEKDSEFVGSLVASSDKNVVRRFEAGKGSGLSSMGSFLLGALFVVLIAAGSIWGIRIMAESRLKPAKIDASGENLRLIEQLKCEGAHKVAFETQCRRFLANFENYIAKEAQLYDDKRLAEYCRENIHAIDPRFSRSLVLLFDAPNHSKPNDSGLRYCFSEGWNESQLPQLKAYAILRRAIDDRSISSRGVHISDASTRSFLGKHLTTSILLREAFSKGSEVEIDGIREYFFWDYIMTEGVAGIVMFSLPVQQAKDSFSLLLNGYAENARQIAFVEQRGEAYFSSAFPRHLMPKILSSDLSAVSGDMAINSDNLNLGDHKFKVIVITLLDKADRFFSIQYLVIFVVVTALLLIFFWFQVAVGNSVINRSVAAKLWVALLVSAVLPIITVFFVFYLFNNEDYNVRISQEKVELQRFADRFELRESFAEPLGWKMLQDWTNSQAMRNIGSQLNNASMPAEIEKLKKDLKVLVESWYAQNSALDRSLINFGPRDVAIAGKTGWDFASSGSGTGEVTKFGQMLQQVARGIINKRVQNMGQVALSGETLGGEIVVETGLQTVRSLFGDDVYVKLYQGVGLPVLMSVLSGTIGVIIHPVPDIEKPDYIMVWMMMFEYEDYMARLARNYKGKYRIFPVAMHQYGNITRPDSTNAFWRNNLTNQASWITSSNLPVSKRIEYENEFYLLEGRPGISQITSLVVALAPEKPIQEIIMNYRLAFYLLMSFSLLLILFVARNVAADILEPVNSLISGMHQAAEENFACRIGLNRSDELGVLCSSFDSMMKGLEEKKLMGRMISKGAHEVSLMEGHEVGKKTECVMLYIGIPAFTTLISGLAADRLFADLQNQITQIAEIVIDEGGDIDKIIGDKMLVVFRVGLNRKAAVTAACRAVTKIIAAENGTFLPFPVALGVNIGTVITGFLGVGEKRDYTVIGDAVNVTARIEGLAETLRFQRGLISERVFELLEKEFVAREYGEVELKGKSLPLKVYQLTI